MWRCARSLRCSITISLQTLAVERLYIFRTFFNNSVNEMSQTANHTNTRYDDTPRKTKFSPRNADIGNRLRRNNIFFFAIRRCDDDQINQQQKYGRTRTSEPKYTRDNLYLQLKFKRCRRTTRANLHSEDLIIFARLDDRSSIYAKRIGSDEMPKRCRASALVFGVWRWDDFNEPAG